MDLIDQLRAGAVTFQPSENRPWVTLSYAQSLDGSIAVNRGAPLALSGPESMHLTHQLRAAHDAILVGIGTVLADDPRLTVRLVEGANPQAVVLDSWLRTPPRANLFQRENTRIMGRPWIATTETADPARERALVKAGARLLKIPLDEEGRIDLGELLGCLAGLGISTLMVEGGAGVIESFLKARLVDFLVLTIAPIMVGGLNAIKNPLSIPTNPPELQNGPSTFLAFPERSFPRLENPLYQQLGDDLVVWGRLITRK
jgi:GTP cyclohydrolase II